MECEFPCTDVCTCKTCGNEKDDEVCNEMVQVGDDFDEDDLDNDFL